MVGILCLLSSGEIWRKNIQLQCLDSAAIALVFKVTWLNPEIVEQHVEDSLMSTIFGSKAKHSWKQPYLEAAKIYCILCMLEQYL